MHPILNTSPQHLTSALTSALQHIATAPNINPTTAKSLLLTISQLSPQLSPEIGNLTTANLPQLRLIAHKLLYKSNLTTLEQSISTHLSALSRRAAIQAETDHLTEKANAARRDKGIYDEGVLGQFIYGLIEEKYLAPVDDKNLTRGYKFNPPEGNEYLEHMSNIHGGHPILTR